MCCCPILEKWGLSKKFMVTIFISFQLRQDERANWAEKVWVQKTEPLSVKSCHWVLYGKKTASNYLTVTLTLQLHILMLDWLRNVGNVGKCWIPSTRRTGLPAGRQKWHNQDPGMSNLKMLVIVIIFIIIIATVSIVVNFIFIVITIKRKAIRTWEGLYSTRCQRWGKGKGRRRFLVKSNNCVNVQDRCKEWKNVLHMFSFMAWRSWVVERRVTHKK